MILGFTGSRSGLSPEAASALTALLGRLRPIECHHGACLGADEAFARLADRLPRSPHIVAHPSDLRGMTSETALGLSDEVMQPRPPLERNLAIVEAADHLLACPAGKETDASQRRSGTWATIRRARRLDKPVTIIWADGSVTEEQRS